MKKLLSFLLSVVFLHAQTAPLLAKRGGPDFGDGSGDLTSVVGTYSGTLIPEDSTDAAATAANGDILNSLGLFSLAMPQTGAGTGDFVIFTEGNVYIGTLTGVGDPDSGKIEGLIEGSFNDVANANAVVELQGVFRAEVTNTVSANVANAASYGIIEGTSQIGLMNGVGGQPSKVVRFDLDGVKQDLAVTTGGLDTSNF